MSLDVQKAHEISNIESFDKSNLIIEVNNIGMSKNGTVHRMYCLHCQTAPVPSLVKEEDAYLPTDVNVVNPNAIRYNWLFSSKSEVVCGDLWSVQLNMLNNIPLHRPRFFE